MLKMLKTDVSTSINGYSEVDGTQVAYYTASIGTAAGANSTISSSISDKALYEANRDKIRSDFADFQDFVWQAEDNLAKNTTTTTTTTTIKEATPDNDLPE